MSKIPPNANLEKYWAEYVESVLSDESPEAISTAERTFYAGAFSAYVITSEAVVANNPESFLQLKEDLNIFKTRIMSYAFKLMLRDK